MKSSKTAVATVLNGQVVLASPLDLPNGTKVQLVPVAVATQADTIAADWPEGYFAATAGQLADEDYERPS